MLSFVLHCVDRSGSTSGSAGTAPTLPASPPSAFPAREYGCQTSSSTTGDDRHVPDGHYGSDLHVDDDVMAVIFTSTMTFMAVTLLHVDDDRYDNDIHVDDDGCGSDLASRR